jgi:transposase
MTTAPDMLGNLSEGAMLLADKGYDANALRASVSDRKAWANLPPKANRKDPIRFSPHLYRARNKIERFFNKIKQFRRIATRYDKLAENYLAALKLVAVRIWLRANESTA